jgi:hypothetical protein
MAKTLEAGSTQAFSPMGRLVVSFNGGTRNVLQGNTVLGRTHEPISLEAGLKTITLATEGADSTTPGTDFTPASRQVRILGGEETHETFRQR